MRRCICSGVRLGRAEVATAYAWLREGLLFCVAMAKTWSGPDEEPIAIHNPSIAPYQAEQYQGGDNISPVCDPPDEKTCTRAVLVLYLTAISSQIAFLSRAGVKWKAFHNFSRGYRIELSDSFFSMDPSLPPTKFQITGLPREEDRISNLPDAVLTHIISLLPPKEAVKTRLVSTRWKYIWTTLPTLRFEMPRVDKKPFMEFVEKTLNLRNGMPFQRFSIHCSENNIYDRIYASLCNVVKGGVQELDLRFCDGSKNVKLPWDALMTCRTLACLRLGHAFVLDVPAEVCFPCLKVLHLRSVVCASDTSLQNLLSGCPVLEELYVRRYLFEKVDNLRRTDYVSVPSLKRLELRVDQLDVERRKSIGETVLFEVSIDAPSLECLVLLDSVSGGYYYMKILPSLCEATIDPIEKQPIG
ncbi:hypothetical protein RJ639_026062 [Escallonia herrerae]|uniref:F-box domain-containing protein n=1 Tax=Escallonia herrerae TaxID=1293975 RepID=A0AA88UXD0_9ASTE|nr:hypothetical protein RJ639_026062 [Escallonia herrerae]